MKVSVAVIGACGRMGGEVVRAVALQPDMTVGAAIEAPGHPLLGSSIGGAVLTGDLEPALAGCDVVVDFSVREAATANVTAAAAAGKPFICGVTGLGDAAMESLRNAARLIPVVYSANFSVGLAVLARLTTAAARLLGEGFDAEVVEVHHRAKKDAPSGTAKLLVGAIQQSRRVTTTTCGRRGITGEKPMEEVGVSSVRTGDVVGEHTVVFGGVGERIELTHRVQSRAAFAAGVVAAIRFLQARKPGWFTMADVLGVG